MVADTCQGKNDRYQALYTDGATKKCATLASLFVFQHGSYKQQQKLLTEV